MSRQEEFRRRLRAVLDTVAGSLTEEQYSAVGVLIDHAEGGEAMLTLAWILAEGNCQVGGATIGEIRELARGLIDDSDFPPGFVRCSLDR